jgi:hypothetical protein
MYLDYTDNEAAMALFEEKRHFIGKAGLFAPIKKGKGGGRLVREQEGKDFAVTGTSGFEWMEADMVLELDREDDIDMSYFDKLASKAIENISKYGDFEWFLSDNMEQPDNLTQIADKAGKDLADAVSEKLAA